MAGVWRRAILPSTMGPPVRVGSEIECGRVLGWLSTVIGPGAASVHGKLLHVGLDARLLVDSVTAPTAAVPVIDKGPGTMECRSSLMAPHHQRRERGLAHALGALCCWLNSCTFLICTDALF